MSYYDFATLTEIVAAAIFALGLAYVAKVHRPVLWSLTVFKPLAAIAAAVSATTAAYYLVIHLEPTYHAQLALLLLIAKDAAGASGVCLLTLVAVQILVVIETRRVRGVAQFFEAAPIVFLIALIAASAIALMNPVLTTNLDNGASSWAVAYRVAIGFPSIVYANLTAFFFLEGYLRRRTSSKTQEHTLLRRYLFIAGSAASLGTIAVLQAAWPANSVTHASGILQAVFFATFAACGLAGLLMRFEPSEIDSSMESFEQYQDIFGQHLAFEVHSLQTEDNQLLGHVPSKAAQRELIRAAAKLLRSLPDYPKITEEEVDLTQKTIAIAAKITREKRVGSHDYLDRIQVFTELPSRYSGHIPTHAPLKHLATRPSSIDRAVPAARMLTETDTLPSLKDSPAWIQLAAAFAASSGQILTSEQERQILDEDLSCLDPNIRWAVVWAHYSLEKSLAFA